MADTPPLNEAAEPAVFNYRQGKVWQAERFLLAERLLAGRSLSFNPRRLNLFRDEVARELANKRAIFGALAKCVRHQNIPESFGADEVNLMGWMVFTTNR